jgi:hypothetical protein
MKGFELENEAEIIQPEVENLPDVKSTTTPSKLGNNGANDNSSLTITQAVAQNFGKILDLAGDIAEIKKMKVASDAVLAKMAEDRKKLLAEAEAYVIKRNADTKSVIDKMNIIRLMMQDFYQQNNQKINGEDFRQIITSIVDQMGRIDNE